MILSTRGFGEGLLEEVTRELTLRDEEGLNQEGRGIPKGKPDMGWKRGRVWCVGSSRGGDRGVVGEGPGGSGVKGWGSGLYPPGGLGRVPNLYCN